VKRLLMVVIVALIAVFAVNGAAGDDGGGEVGYAPTTRDGVTTDEVCVSGPSPELVCPAPRVSIWASPNPVAPGAYTTLTWTVENLTGSCSSNFGGSGQGGSRSVGPIYSSTRFTYSCTNPDGQSGSAYVDVNVTSSSPPPPPPPPPPPGCTWGSSFVSMGTVPSAVQVNSTFAVPVTYQNTGTCPWTKAELVRLGTQNPENNTSWNLPLGGNRIELGDTESVPASGLKTFNVTARAPATAGAYNFQFRVVLEGRAWLGTPTAGPGNGLSTNAVVSVTSGTPPPPPDPLTFQCAVRAGAVTRLGNRIQSFLENRCRKQPFRLSAHVCLMRKASFAAPPEEFACASKQSYGSLSLTVNTNKVCNYTTYAYSWYSEGYGTVTFANPTRTFVSPKIQGKELIHLCN
jgi:hypothetical protein